MLSVAEAIAAVLKSCSPFSPQPILLSEALGLVLAESIHADSDSPPFDKSLVDGFAFRRMDFANTSDRGPLPIIEVVLAGQVPRQSLVEPTAIQIMTGAPLPVGADAVVPVEWTTLQTAPGELPRVTFLKDVSAWKAGTNIVRRGASTQRGDLVVAAGSELRPQELGALAELGRATILARRRPTVAVLATGDELVLVDQTPGPGQIRNSNETMLCAQIQRAGGEPLPLGIARDERTHLAQRIAAGLQADVLVLSGGVSMGELDLVPSELAAAGVEEVFHKVNVKPGKPAWFGVRKDSASHRTLVFGLPGNPVSSLVCFELFVRPALRRLMGHEPAESQAMSARLQAIHTTKGDRPTYHPARLEFRSDGPIVTAIPWVGSSDLRATVGANSMALFPIGDQKYEPGAVLDVIPW